MTKEQMINNLGEYGITDIPQLKWHEFQKFYYHKIKEVGEMKIKKPDQKDVDENLERKIKKQPDTRTKLEKKRAELYPQIIDLMKRLKGRSSATQDELRELFKLYNAFYLRNDSPSCGACVARAYKSFEKMTKGHI